MRFLRQSDVQVTDRVTTDNDYYYPNRMGRIVLTAMDDIMGRHGVNATLNFAGLDWRVDNYPPNNLELGFTFTELATIQQALDDLFGNRGGRALSLRIGRETFKYALKEFMPILGIADLAFRPLHLGIKIKIGLEIFAETFNKFTDQIVTLAEEPDRHLWIIERCPVCWQRDSEQPCCHLAVGLLQESLSWVSNGREFGVHEEQCVATGHDVCAITIFKQPIR
ncbi:MAG: 4-vinyl reductase [Chloroflexota bacterium]|nr:MAG: 4-vinyl reductase [Chloroflexota bacterium]